MSRQHRPPLPAEALEPRLLCAALNSYEVLPLTTVPVGLIAGPDHMVWYGSGNTDADASATADYGTEYTMPVGSSSNSFGGGLLALARGPGNSIWSIAQAPNEIIDQVDAITGRDSATFTYPLPHGTDPHGLIEGPDQNFYFVSYAKSFVGQVTPGGKLTEFPIPAADKPSLPAAPPTTQTIIIDANGNVTFADGNQILSMSTSGVFAPPVIVSLNAQVDGMTVFDRYIYFTESDGNIAILTPGATVATDVYYGRGVATGITAGGDGNLYACVGDELVGIPPAGFPVFKQFLGAAGTDMATDDDGNVWIVEPSPNRLAELDLNPSHTRQSPTLEFTAQPTLSVAGQTLAAPAVQVSAINLVTGAETASTDSVTLSIASGPGGTLGGTLTEPLVKGVATFEDLSVSAPGIYTIAASDIGDLPTISKSFAVTVAQFPTLVPKIDWPLVRQGIVSHPQLGGVPIPPPPAPGNTILVTLTNEMSSPMSGRATVRMFASPDGAVDVDSALLLTRIRRVNLAPGQSTVLRLPASLVRNRVPWGNTYVLAAEAVAPNGVANDVDSGLAVPTQDPFVPPTLYLGGAGPLSVAPGEWVSMWVYIADSSIGGFFVGGRLTLVPSIDGVTPLLDQVLASVPVAPIAYNGGRNVLLRFRIPVSLPSTLVWPYVILTARDYTQTAVGTAAVGLI